jgi:CDP-diacylglycerol--serine O-phosphatidyltransferase
MRRMRPRRQIPRAAVPSFFTLMNLFCGYLAITQCMEGRFDHACWLIVVAGFFDALDGMMARLTNGTSLFGVELDSLSDIVSFGVAPGFLVYVFSLKTYGTLGLIVSSLPAICGAVRLARYNVGFDGEKKEYFQGLPIPMQAIAIVALILNFNDEAFFYEFSLNNFPVLIPIVFVLSALMISTIKFDAVPRPSATYIRAHPRKAMAYGVAILLLAFLQQIGLLIVLVLYVAYGIGYSLYSLIQKVLSMPTEGEEAG